MNKIILFFCILFSTSCSLPSYYFENKTQKTGLDFTKGKWLLNEIEAPYEVKQNLTKLALNDFSSYLSNRLVYIHNAKGILLPRKIELNPNKNQIKDLKTGTQFDYFINIKGYNSKSELANMDLTNHKFNKNSKNTGELIIEVYDLNNLEIVFSQKVVGSTSAAEGSNNDVNFYRSTNELIIGGYKKVMKEIDKMSLKI